MRYGWDRLLLVVLLLSAYQPLFAVRSLKLSISKEQAIIIEVPPNQWAQKEASWSEGMPISILRVDREFLASRRWEDGTLPLLADFHIQKAQDCGSGVMSGRIVGCPPKWSQIELRSPKAWLKIQISPEISDVESALKQIAFIGTVSQFEETNYLHDKVFLPNQVKLFAALPRLDLQDRYRFFKLGVIAGFDVSSVSFKSKGYIYIKIPATNTYNTIRLSQDQRVSEVIKETILPEAKTFFSTSEAQPIDGMAFSVLIPAYNFVTGGEAKFDSLMIYLPVESLKQFYESDITSQKLFDNSIVLLNDDRIEVKL